MLHLLEYVSDLGRGIVNVEFMLRQDRFCVLLLHERYVRYDGIISESRTEVVECLTREFFVRRNNK